MEEVLKLIDEIEIKLPKDSAIKLKMQLLKSLTIGADDLDKLVNSNDLEGVELRLKNLRIEQMKIKGEFVSNKFASGGLIINQNK